MSDPIPSHIQRFILTSVDSVPHLEALMLLHKSATDWAAGAMAKSLFIAESRAAEILADLCKAGFAAKGADDAYHYEPASQELRDALDELSRIYPRQVVQVSQLIHGKIDKQAQSFGDAFKWKKE